MIFRNEIEQYLEQIQTMEETFRQVRDMEMLPLSFFSSTYDTLRKLSEGVHELETKQFQRMEEHLSHVSPKPEPEFDPEPKIDSEPKPEPITAQEPLVVKSEPVTESSSATFLGDVIGNKLFPDFKHSLSLNDRFRFQRDLFAGNLNSMNETLEQLNRCQTLKEAQSLLDTFFHWNWEEESPAAFKELLEKRFA